MTERLVCAGYQQKDGGYIKRAKTEGLLVDYTKDRPSQYWHLMTFAYSRPPQEKFTRTIQCGELIFWMAEVSDSVPADSLAMMVGSIAQNAIGYDGDRPIYDRRHWNKEIQRLCFDAIKTTIENHRI
ncbi:MAG: hypothetical protein IKW85_08280 [Muribaculaceae bacterium]|nr:hypothetical protein [Muribaculaceae bacterium]